MFIEKHIYQNVSLSLESLTKLKEMTRMLYCLQEAVEIKFSSNVRIFWQLGPS